MSTERRPGAVPRSADAPRGEAPTHRGRMAVLGLVGVGVATSLAGQAPSSDRFENLAAARHRAERALQVDEPELAESALRTLIHDGLLLLGAIELEAGETAAARTSFGGAVEAVADPEAAWLALARVDLADDQPMSAVRRLRPMVTARPDDGVLRRQLSQALIAADRPEEAIQELEEHCARVPDDLETVFALASGYLRLGRLADAERWFGRLVAARPGAATHSLVGRTYRDSSAFDRARVHLEEALALDPTLSRARYYLGTVAIADQGLAGLPEARRWFAASLEHDADDPMALLYYGLALAEGRSFEEALGPLEAAKVWAPTRLDAMRYLGRSLLGLERHDEAIATLQEALEWAEHVEARPRQISGIRFQLASALRQVGREKEALAQFAEARALSETLVQEERNRFDDYVAGLADLEGLREVADLPAVAAANEKKATREEGEARTRIMALTARAYMDLGVLQVRARRFPRAVVSFERAERLDPKLEGLAHALGAARFNTGDFAGAGEALARAGVATSDDPAPRRMLGMAWLNAGRWSEAAALLAVDPERQSDPRLAYAYALASARSGAADEAQAVLRDLLLRHDDWPDLHVLMGQAQSQDGDDTAARSAFERAVALDRSVAGAHVGLGMIHLRRGELEAAERAFRAELASHPTDVQARYRLAVVLELAQRSDEALEALEQVLAAQPSFADARYLTGKVLVAGGAFARAVPHLEAAAALAPEDANIRYQLALALQRSGQSERAREAMAAYRSLKRPEDGETGNGGADGGASR